MRIGITSMACWTAFGHGVSTTFNAWCEGRVAIDGQGPFPGRGPVAAIPGGPHLSSALATHVVREALDGRDPSRMALIGGTTSGDMVRGEAEFADDLAGRPVTDGFLWSQLCDRPTQVVADTLGFCGPRITVSTACSSSSAAVGIALDMLRSGRVNQAMVFGTDALCGLTVHGFGSLGAMSQTPARPFKADRSGLSLGEGAAAFVLERSPDVPLAWVSGFGMASDAHHMTAPHPQGRGARRAIREAGLMDVDWVCAHGTATSLNDAMERPVLTDLFPGIPFSSIKGSIGHTLGAAGAIELVQTVEAVRTGRLPAVHGTNVLPERVRGALSVNFAFGGHNTAVRIARC